MYNTRVLGALWRLQYYDVVSKQPFLAVLWSRGYGEQLGTS
jgi:hypothetical protein